MDSATIAARLESLHPSPSLHLSSPVLSQIYALVPRVQNPLRTLLAPRIHARILNPASQPYWHETRSASLGMPLERLAEAHPAEACWEGAEAPLREVTALLEKDGAGPFFEGDQVGYVDFVWTGFLLFVRRIGEDLLEEVYKRSGNAEAHRKLLEAVQPWAERAAE
jgi:glutathione S-transferase